jgi:PKD repeat protein
MGTAANGCTAVAKASLKTWALPQPSLNVSPSNEACLNQVFTLQGYGAAYYGWAGPYNFNNYGETFSFKASSLAYSGIYTLTGVDEHNCHSQITTTITIDELPAGSLMGGILDQCAPFCSEYRFVPFTTSASITSVIWMVNNTPAGERQFKYCFNTPGVYIMSGMLSDIKGCSNTTTMAVIARDRPVGDFSFSPLNPVENEDEVLFEANNGAASGDKKISKWTWELDIESLRNKVQSSKSFNYIFKEAGMYPVVLTVENIYGCKDTVIKTIRVEEDFSAFVPSATIFLCLC